MLGAFPVASRTPAAGYTKNMNNPIQVETRFIASFIRCIWMDRFQGHQRG